MTGYAVGPIYMKSEAEIDRAFEYAKRVGVKLIVGVPNYELLPYVDKKVKEYDFHYAIHLHGPDIKTYPDATDVWEHVKELDARIGMCLDVGHDLRNGCDPVADLERYHSRVFDMHIKDVTDSTKAGHAIELGRGKIDFVSLVKMMRKVNYTGMCSLEYEKVYNGISYNKQTENGQTYHFCRTVSFADSMRRNKLCGDRNLQSWRSDFPEGGEEGIDGEQCSCPA